MTVAQLIRERFCDVRTASRPKDCSRAVAKLLRPTFVCHPPRKQQITVAFIDMLSLSSNTQQMLFGEFNMGIGPSDSLIAHKAINLCEDLSGSEKRVAAAIIDHFNRKTGQCDPALGSLARLLGIHRRTVIRAVTALVAKGYLRKDRHGGHFHRNQYEPVWSRFRAKEIGWNSRRQQMRRKAVATDLSPLRGSTCHVGSDVDVTQTSPTNSSYLISEVETPLPGVQPPAPLRDRKGSAEECKTVGLSKAIPGRMIGRTVKHGQAARDAAERRWNDALTQRYIGFPDVYAAVVDAIDADTCDAATNAEMRESGSGIALVERRLSSLLLPHQGRSA